MLPYKGHLRWAYTEWTSASQRTVREVIHRFFKKDDGAGTAETSHSLWNDVTGDAGREYHAVRAVYDQTAQYDKVWYFDNQRRLSIFDERKAGGVTTVRKTFSWSVTPVTGQPFIWQVDTTLEPWRGNAITRRSTQSARSVRECDDVGGMGPRLECRYAQDLQHDVCDGCELYVALHSQSSAAGHAAGGQWRPADYAGYQ